MSMKQIRSCMRIPLENIDEVEKKKIKDMGGKILIVNADSCCLTCGRHKRMKYTQHIDGKLFVIEECIYCTIKNGNGKQHGTLTAANRATE
jgi:hypothetical protein